MPIDFDAQFYDNCPWDFSHHTNAMEVKVYAFSQTNVPISLDDPQTSLSADFIVTISLIERSFNENFFF